MGILRLKQYIFNPMPGPFSLVLIFDKEYQIWWFCSVIVKNDLFVNSDWLYPALGWNRSCEYVLINHFLSTTAQNCQIEEGIIFYLVFFCRISRPENALPYKIKNTLVYEWILIQFQSYLFSGESRWIKNDYHEYVLHFIRWYHHQLCLKR